jgi:serine/threonine protein kinase
MVGETDDPKPGDLVAERFRLERWLGAGGMGTVWAATNLFTRREVALKFLIAARQSEPGARARLLREARAACRVRHPNVVAVHDLLDLDGAPVLVMDLLEGETLGERLRREGRLSPSQVVHVAREILAALESAHESGIVHRDLKPDNVFLSETAGEPEVKLLDFGIAKLTRQDDVRGLSTETGTLLGTPHYMAPEQAFGELRIDGRADLWALGVVMYECLSGSRPLDGANVGQVLKKLAKAEIAPLGPEVPRDLARFVERLLCDRNQRIQSATLALGELGRATIDDGVHSVASAPASARVDTPEPHSIRIRTVGERRSRWGVVVGLSVVATALGWFSLSTRGDDRVRAPLRHALQNHAAFAPPVPAPARSAVQKPVSSAPKLRATQRSLATKVPELAPSAQPSVGADKLIAEPRF